eukprot:TRINITY_DN22342_c0_g1_i1.p1 TRINITY_DN22342_c0_g1~~TRINITY_DN22342_c0_g1_i1.p1  ORF type:complete len:429 (+),score=83.29 TRINITY_DN22342_c0_g1_i1:93-1379(+)
MQDEDECPPPMPSPFGDELEQIPQIPFDNPFIEDGDDIGFSPFGFLPGDCYREEDDVRRGIAIVLDSDHGTPFVGDTFKDQFKDPYAIDDLKASLPAAEASAGDMPDFRSVGPPPSLPFGGVGASTVALESASAAEAMEELHAFLREGVMASILKFRPAKCTMTAVVFVKSQEVTGQCELKLRIYLQAAPPRLLVEFQRRDRNSLVFARAFRQAVSYLQKRFYVVAVGGDCAAAAGKLSEPAVPQWLPPEADRIEAADLQPLVDRLMDASGSLPDAQVEALQTLVATASGAAENAAAVGAMLQQHAHMAADLLMHPALEVALSAACLASCLASQRNGNAELASALQRGALQAVTEDSTDKRVREELSRVLRDTLVNFGRGPPFMPTDEMRRAVTVALGKPVCSNPAVAGCLRESLAALDLEMPAVIRA